MLGIPQTWKRCDVARFRAIRSSWPFEIHLGERKIGSLSGSSTTSCEGLDNVMQIRRVWGKAVALPHYQNLRFHIQILRSDAIGYCNL
jgi:hypothetical protein